MRLAPDMIRRVEDIAVTQRAAERAERRKADDAAKDSVKKINASVEKTTLGDISSLAELKAKMESAEQAKAPKAAEEAKAE